MADFNKDDERAIRTGDDGSTSVSDSSLLPMLVTSLVLIVVGMIAVIIFVFRCFLQKSSTEWRLMPAR